MNSIFIQNYFCPESSQLYSPMSIILIYKKEIKLYNDKLNFSMMTEFAAKEFKLVFNSVSLSFKDDEGDMITIISDDDLEVIQTIFPDKQYIKIIVDGDSNIKFEENQDVSETTEPVEETKPETNHHEERCDRSRSRSGSKKKKKKEFMKMNSFFDEIVSKLVDKRINSLVPCMKEKVQSGEQPVSQSQSDLIHKGIECKGCAMSPITGIRYKCPTCVDFNFCKSCEQKMIDHEHPLLKIKKVLEEEKEEEEEYYRIQKLFKQSSKGRGQSQWKGHRHMKKIWGLSALFGGKPETYSEFAEKYPDLRPKDVFAKYAEENNVPKEEFNKKFVNMRCQKLSHKFGKPAEEYKTFVEENLDLPQKELIGLLFEKGMQKRENKRCCWWGKRVSFNDVNKEEESAKAEKECPKKKDRSGSKKKKKKNERKHSPLVEEPKSLDKAEVVQAKGAILLKMLQIFGNERKKDYVKFIDRYFYLEQDKIIELWMSL